MALFLVDCIEVYSSYEGPSNRGCKPETILPRWALDKLQHIDVYVRDKIVQHLALDLTADEICNLLSHSGDGDIYINRYEGGRLVETDEVIPLMQLFFEEGNPDSSRSK